MEVDDNYERSPSPGPAVTTLSVSAGFNAARESESSATRLAGNVGLFQPVSQGGRNIQNRVDLNLDFSQSRSYLLDTYTGALQFRRDSTAEATRASEVALGRGETETTSARLNWSRALSERSNTNLGLNSSSTRYGGGFVNAVNYRNGSLAGGISYRLTEIDSLGLQLSGSRYRTLTGSSRSRTNSASLNWQHAFSERSSGSLSVGRNRTTTRSSQDVLVCPLPIAFCTSGVVDPIVAQIEGVSTRSGGQYEASLNHQFDEVTSLAVSASNRVTPSGAGVVLREEALQASVRRSFSQTFSASAAVSASRGNYFGSNAAEPRFREWSLGFSKALDPDLSLEGGFRSSRSDDVRANVHSTSNVVFLTLRLQGPKLFAFR